VVLNVLELGEMFVGGSFGFSCSFVQQVVYFKPIFVVHTPVVSSLTTLV
jgi:hypothetical protein